MCARCFVVFGCPLSKGNGAVIMTDSDGGRRLKVRLLLIIYEEFAWDAGVKPIPRGYGPPTPSK